MKSSKLFAPLAAVAIVLSSAAAIVACGGDDSSQPGPTPRDGGTTDTSVGNDTGTGGDTGPGQDTGVPDTGSCMSDAATCNSCYSPMQAAQDPYNACAPSTANCIPFNNTTRVPANVPPVP